MIQNPYDSQMIQLFYAEYFQYLAGLREKDVYLRILHKLKNILLMIFPIPRQYHWDIFVICEKIGLTEVDQD